MVHSTLNILHIEDDPADALLIQEMLKSQAGATSDYNLVHVDNLKGALSKLREEGFNAVLLDLGLKDISGLDNVKVIKEENPDIPIVVLTGLNSEDIALQAVKQGAQEYIVKGHGDGKVVSLAIKSSIERKAYERQLFHQANYDDLTGLPNRRFFVEHLKNTLIKAKRWERQETIMFLDLNKFKEINDTMGHEVGNQLIQQVAERLKSVLRMSDVMARYGGDEFVIHLDDRTTSQREGCINVAEKIFATFDTPFVLVGGKADISASIGIAIYPDAGKEAADLLKSADHAMYTAKRLGLNKHAFAD